MRQRSTALHCACVYMCYLSIVGMIAGGGPLGGGGKPGGGTVMGNPTREEESINTLKTIKQSKYRVKSNTPRDQLRKKKMMMLNLLGGGMSGGAVLTLGGGGRKGGGGMFGGSGPGGKNAGILAAGASESDCSAITCTTTEQQTGEVEMMTHTHSFFSLSPTPFRVLLSSKCLCCFCAPGYCCHLHCVCVVLQPC